MIRDKRKNAFTLVEMIVSVSIFSVIILAMTGIFKLAIDAQRSAIATQNVQESLKYFLEVTGKEMRMAQKNKNMCPGIGDDVIFAVTTNAFGDVLNFRNYYGECVTYQLASDGTNQRFQISRQQGLSAMQTDFISPAKIKINSLHFILNSTLSTIQPMVTINLGASALGASQFKSSMTIQTSIASRYYK
jgi:prepilin-type N-terminal cleavage/methylation domain-containing protein